MVTNTPYPLSRWIAHRGGGALAPENTLAGFRLAARLGYSAVEFDVMLSADGVPVIMHDEALVRTTGHPGRVPDLSAVELKSLDAGAAFHRAFAHEPIPTFAELIRLCAELRLAANVEIKPADGFAHETGQVVARMVSELWPQNIPVLLSSFDEDALSAAHLAAPELPRALLFETIPDDWMQRLQNHRCVALHCHHSQLETSCGRDVLDSGVPVAVYTVNQSDLAEACWRLGASAVFSDRLDLFQP